MRRFIAYMSLALAGLATVGATFNSAFTKAKTNIEYTDGRALVFRVSDEENEELPDDAALQIAETMQERLEIYGETRYDVVTEGHDTVKVVLSEEQEGYYGELKRYLSFNGAFALGTKTNVVAIGDEFMDTTKDAYVTFINYYPTVVIPVNKESEEFQAVIEEAKKLKQDAEDSNTDPENPVDTSTYVYLAYNFVEGEDTISSLVEGSDDYDQTKYEDKYLMQFDISNIYLDDEENAIATSVNVDQNGDGSASTAEMMYASHMARYTINLLNSEELPFNVEYIYETKVPAYFENLVSYGMRENVAWSRTLVATIFAILIISLVLAVFYRWGALALASISICSVYVGLLLSILFTVEFNTAAIIGFACVALVSLLSGVIYLTKTKEECYRGRTLRKANAEGSKKSLLPIVDLHVMLIIVGACVFWLGGTTMISFAAATVFGGLASLVLNTLGLKGLMWLLTNTTRFTGKYEIIGVETKRVPNVLNEEKQSYYGPFQDVKVFKHKKTFGIIGAVLGVAALAGSITFGVLNNGVVFNEGNYASENTYLYVETTTKNSTVDLPYVENLISRTYIIDNISEVNADSSVQKHYTQLELDSIDVYEHVKTENKVEVTYVYIVATLANNYTGNEIAVISGSDNALNEDGTLSDIVTGELLLSEVFNSYLSDEDVDFNASASLKIGTLVSAQQPDYIWVIIATCVGAAFTMLYLVLRYGISKGLTSLLFAGMSGIITVGVLSLSRFVLGLNLFIALPAVIIIAFALTIIIMNKEKEMLAEDIVKTKDNTIENRLAIVEKANALALAPVLVFGAIGIYLSLNFFGFGPSATASIYGFVLLGCVVALVFISLLYSPTSHALYKLLKKMNIKKPTIRHKHKRKVVKKNSSEPEEAIFIGIND